MNKQISLLVMGQTNHGKTTLINAINSSTNNNYKYINFETNKELTNQNINTAILVVNVLELSIVTISPVSGFTTSLCKIVLNFPIYHNINFYTIIQKNLYKNIS